VPTGALTQDQGSFAAWVVSPEHRVHAVRVRVLGESNGKPVVAPSDEAWSSAVRLAVAPALGLTEGMLVAAATAGVEAHAEPAPTAAPGGSVGGSTGAAPATTRAAGAVTP
jgi:hypothetical protein